MAQRPQRQRHEIINRAPREAMDVFVMGANEKGQLGLGPGQRVFTIAQSPRRNDWISDEEDIVDIACGNNHCLALTDDNRVMSWGSNDHGALGRVTHLPRNINHLAIERNTVFTQVAVSDHASFALTETGQVYGWGAFKYYVGENDFIDFHHVHHFYAFHPGQMEYDQHRPRRNQQYPLKIRFPGTDNPQIVQIACGANHVLALSKSGLVYSWGTNDAQILGRRFMPRNAYRRSPRRQYVDAEQLDPYANMDHHFAPGLVAELQNIRYVACGANYSMANDDMQTTLPLSKTTVVATPEHPDAPDGENMRVMLFPTKAPWFSGIGHRVDEPESALKAISGSLRYGLAIRHSGWGDAWGNEHELPSAMGVVDADNEPVIPAVPPGNRYTQAPQFAGWHYHREDCRFDLVATGEKHSIAVDQEGKVYV
ncbi:hypothetical protein SMACR_01218 [Sordaria macrospora]|uniref:WGS project CABT00000000 data, contig 2.4 n=2 Tax=Sordaria macrospora TaxID=5147 RepID=F7VQ68_SORMK|nr:uncharacterized protein SMAC_01218 [Sordaria macrospora k-hell]KAA8630389.1 hypothetical protein SMACR_01218 [Sordaria macrospora]KAH7634293.1 regulator of chromosome condensation 1/beta-lactamase-inhibitor protein II [Sordaria sp. MPI-SDFR-AT-0083]WPJ58905.1 hypothetical protein SMAC4_01218 [Sordaria macrospora]CCC07650.1 unnamed protein product [Sordaria macrospora k-hell]